MNLTLSTATMNLMSDGIILLDQKGRPREVNAAAQPWLRRCVEFTQKWARSVEQVQAGSVTLPLVVDIDTAGDGPPPATVHLLKNGNHGYALLIRPMHAVLPKSAHYARSDFLVLLGGDVRKEIARFSSRLHESQNSIARSADLMQQATRLNKLLTEVGDLADLVQRDEVFADERLAVADIVRAILPRLPRTNGEDTIRYVLTDSNGNLAPVYGNQKWLSQALHTLLARLGRDCPEHGIVAIDLRQIGDFLVINGRATADSAGWYAGPTVALAARSADSLEAEICHRIIELHGGQIKVRLIDKEAAPEGGEAIGPIESVTLTLPTGVPSGDRSRVSCAECRITLQSMQYARDLAEMMSAGGTANNPTKEH